ncbi:MAG: YHS domain-containing (seleno)protein [Verrucomicrobiota bacterium]
MKRLLYTLLLFTLAQPLFAQTKTLHNLDKAGVAIQGHDPVAFFADSKPVRGNPSIYATYKGALYYFASKENKERFLKAPAKYEPAFGGYCAFGVSKGKLVEIDPEAFQIVDGRLLLQYSKSVRNDFNKDAPGNMKKADANWPGLLEKKGK